MTVLPAFAAVGGEASPSPTSSLAAGTAGFDRHWRFRVLVDGREIGFHEFLLAEQDGTRRLQSRADFEYRFMFVTLYQYEHRAAETWHGECLERIESSTDANGKPYAVVGARDGEGFRVRASRNGEPVARDLPGCVMSFAYWNPAFLTADRLLNTQNGEYLDVRFSAPVADQVALGGRPVAAQRYHLSAGDLSMTLWYSADRDWLGLETRYANGRTLRYERVVELPALAGGPEPQ